MFNIMIFIFEDKSHSSCLWKFESSATVAAVHRTPMYIFIVFFNLYQCLLYFFFSLVFLTKQCGIDTWLICAASRLRLFWRKPTRVSEIIEYPCLSLLTCTVWPRSQTFRVDWLSKLAAEQEFVPGAVWLTQVGIRCIRIRKGIAFPTLDDANHFIEYAVRVDSLLITGSYSVCRSLKIRTRNGWNKCTWLVTFSSGGGGRKDGGGGEWRIAESTRLSPMWPGFDFRRWRHTWVEFVVGFCPYSKCFSPGSPVFHPPQNPSFQIPIRPGTQKQLWIEFLGREYFGAPWVNKLHLRLGFFFQAKGQGHPWPTTVFSQILKNTILGYLECL